MSQMMIVGVEALNSIKKTGSRAVASQAQPYATVQVIGPGLRSSTKTS